MKFPRLKNPLLCRIFVYIVVIGGFAAPVIIAANLKFIPKGIKVLIAVASMIGLVIYLIKNFVLLMTMDMLLAIQHCVKTARERFVLPDSFSAEKAQKRISKFGKAYKPIKIHPQPEMLRYKSSAPITIFSSGIERVFVTYHTDCLDKNNYLSIVNSAKANSNSLKGKKKHLLLDKEQRKAAINQATAIIIFADKVEENFQNDLSETVCKNNGDDYDISVLPCIIDLENNICTFNSMRIPYMGYQYPMKNRGIKMIKKYIFGGRFPYKSSPDLFTLPKDDLDDNQSLWEYWKESKRELKLDAERNKKLFKKMKHGEVILEDGYIYVKWKEQGIWLSVELDEEEKTAEIDSIDLWDYPKTSNISKSTINSLKNLINTHFSMMGYSTKYISLDD